MSFMGNNQDSAMTGTTTANIAGVEVNVRPLMKLVYLWMTLGILVSAIVSLIVMSSPELLQILAPAYMPLLIAQFVLVLAISWGTTRMSPALASALFFLYAGMVGLTLGVIFFMLSARGQEMAIVSAFFTTAGLFGTMTVIGYTTKVDLSKYSSFFMMALIGLVIAIVVNMFLLNDTFGLIISIFGVLVFTALTAWDTQKIKKLAQQPEYQQYSDSTRRLAVLGALTLYLDFLNMFLFLLSIFAGRD